MRVERTAIVATVVAATVLVAGAAEGGVAEAAKRKPRVTQVSVDSRSTLKLSTFPAPGADTSGVSNSIGMRFAGSLAFTKVQLHPSRAKVTKMVRKKIRNKARKTCVKLFARGPVDGLTPKVQVWTHVGPIPGQEFTTQRQSLATSDFLDTDISGAGTKSVLWNEQARRVASFEEHGRTWYGITPGYPITAKGGWYDPVRGIIRDHSGAFKIKQRGKRGKVTVNCSRFEVSTEWNG
jgi:hypothetical protein